MGVAKSAAGVHWGKVALRAGVAVVSLAAAWLTLTAYPEPLFAYSLRKDNIVLYARAPLAGEAPTILSDAYARVLRSPLYDAVREQHVFLCDSEALYGFLEPRAHGSGRTNVFGNVFIRGARVHDNRVVDRNGREKNGERTLAYFIAHELTHAMSIDRFGIDFQALSSFQKEGYADYVARDQPVDLRAGLAALHRNAYEMNPSVSGLYDRYRLLVAYRLQQRGETVPDLLGHPLRERDVEAQMLADPSLR
jgi:hypothetical protein